MAYDINIGLGIDASDVIGEEENVEKRIDELDGRDVKVSVDADTSKAEKKIDALAKKRVSVRVEAGDNPEITAKVVQPETIKPTVEQPTVTPKVETPVVKPEVETPVVKATVIEPHPVTAKVVQPETIKPTVEQPTVTPKVETPVVKPEVSQDSPVEVYIRTPRVEPDVVVPVVTADVANPTIEPIVKEPEPVTADVKNPTVEPNVDVPEVTAKVKTPVVKPEVVAPDIPLDRLLNISDALQDIDRFSRKMAEMRGSVPIDAIVNVNGVIAQMREELKSGTPDIERMARHGDDLATAIKGIGFENLAKVSVPFSNMSASIKSLTDSIREEVSGASEETTTHVVASVDGLIAAIGELDAKAASYGTAQAKQIQNTLADMTNALKGGAELDAETIRGLATWFDKLIEQGKKLPPAGLVKMGKEIQKVASSYADFQNAIVENNAIEWKVNIHGIDKFDELNRKIEIVQSAQGLDDGIKELQAALASIDDRNATEAMKTIERIRDLMNKDLNADNMKAMNAEMAKFAKLQSGMSTRDIHRLAPAFQNALNSLVDLQRRVSPLRDSLRSMFDGASFSASVLSGDINGIGQGLVGLAAGAGRASGAMKAMGMSLATGGIAVIIGMAVKLAHSLYEEWVKVRKEMERMPNETSSQTTDMTVKRLEGQLAIIRRVNDEQKRGIDIEKDRLEAALSAEKAKDDLAKTRELSTARTDADRSEVEQRYKERQDERDYRTEVAGVESSIEKIASDRKALQKELARLNNAQKSLRESAAGLTADMKGDEWDNYVSQLTDMLGITENEKNVIDAAEIRKRINDTIQKNGQRIREIEGSKAGKDGKKAIQGELAMLDRQEEILRIERSNIESRKSVIDSENRVARVEEARRIHMLRYQRAEQIGREEYDRNEQERQYQRRQENANGGLGRRMADATNEVLRWENEENDENAVVETIRGKYAEKMTADDQSSYDALRRKESELDVRIANSEGEQRRNAIAEQMAVRDRISMIEMRYFKEMEAEDAARLQNALNYRSAARNNKYAAMEAEADMIRQRTMDDMQRLHSIRREDDLYVYNRLYGKVGMNGQVALAQGKMDKAKETNETAQNILDLDADGKISKELNKNGDDVASFFARFESIGIKLSEADKEEMSRTGGLSAILRQRVETARDESRQDFASARQQVDTAKDERQRRENEFAVGQIRNSNRLTAMGLGGGNIADWDRQTSINTNKLVGLTREMIKSLRVLGSTHRMAGTGNTNNWTRR